MEVLTKFFTVFVIAAALSLLFALPVMWLWNWLMPEIFGLVEIGFWQALGLNLLSGFLFNQNSSISTD